MGLGVLGVVSVLFPGAPSMVIVWGVLAVLAAVVVAVHLIGGPVKG